MAEPEEPISEEDVSVRLVELKPESCLVQMVLQTLPSGVFEKRGRLLLVDLFSACITLTYLHHKVEEASVTVIPKPRTDASRADNLWPISHLTSTSEVSEHLLQCHV